MAMWLSSTLFGEMCRARDTPEAVTYGKLSQRSLSTRWLPKTFPRGPTSTIPQRGNRDTGGVELAKHQIEVLFEDSAKGPLPGSGH
jgi:hypothetical protein